MDNISLLKNYLKKGKLFKLFLNEKWSPFLAKLIEFFFLSRNLIHR